jgi:hypothetical protein
MSNRKIKRRSFNRINWVIKKKRIIKRVAIVYNKVEVNYCRIKVLKVW